MSFWSPSNRNWTVPFWEWAGFVAASLPAAATLTRRLIRMPLAANRRMENLLQVLTLTDCFRWRHRVVGMENPSSCHTLFSGGSQTRLERAATLSIGSTQCSDEPGA